MPVAVWGNLDHAEVASVRPTETGPRVSTRFRPVYHAAPYSADGKSARGAQTHATTALQMNQGEIQVLKTWTWEITDKVFCHGADDQSKYEGNTRKASK